MRGDVLAVERPGHRLTDRPGTRALAVEAELRAEPIQAMQSVTLGMSELERPNDRCDREFTFSEQRLRVDHEPRLAYGSEDVVAVEILMEEHLLALRLRDRGKRVDRGVHQPALDRTARAFPLLRQVLDPPRGLVLEGMKRLAGLDPQPR